MGSSRTTWTWNNQASSGVTSKREVKWINPWAHGRKENILGQSWRGELFIPFFLPPTPSLSLFLSLSIYISGCVRPLLRHDKCIETVTRPKNPRLFHPSMLPNLYTLKGKMGTKVDQVYTFTSITEKSRGQKSGWGESVGRMRGVAGDRSGTRE